VGLGMTPVWSTASPTRSGKMAMPKGPRPWSGMTVWNSGEDLTIAQRLQGRLNDGMGFEEVDDGAGSRKIFSGKFC
jgi:hypothetical protein